MPVHYGKAFRWVRIAQGLTQEDFAESSGRTYVSELERGVKQPTVAKLAELSEILGVHPLTVLTLAHVSNGGVRAADRLLEQVRNELALVVAQVPEEPT